MNRYRSVEDLDSSQQRFSNVIPDRREGTFKLWRQLSHLTVEADEDFRYEDDDDEDVDHNGDAGNDDEDDGDDEGDDDDDDDDDKVDDVDNFGGALHRRRQQRMCVVETRDKDDDDAEDDVEDKNANKHEDGDDMRNTRPHIVESRLSSKFDADRHVAVEGKQMHNSRREAAVTSGEKRNKSGELRGNKRTTIDQGRVRNAKSDDRKNGRRTVRP